MYKSCIEISDLIKMNDTLSLLENKPVIYDIGTMIFDPYIDN
jgi:hypothetical protein